MSAARAIAAARGLRGLAPGLAWTLAGVLAALPAAAGAEPLDGLWRTEPRANGAYLLVRIAPCRAGEEARCGTIAGVRGGARPDILGEPILRGMTREGEGRWTGGEIIRPGEGTVYRSDLTLEDEDRLVVRGCALGGLVCGGQTWERAR